MDAENDHPAAANDLTRRTFIGTAAMVSGIAIGSSDAEAQSAVHSGHEHCSLTINNVRHELEVEPA
jgi:hypothetical protein